MWLALYRVLWEFLMTLSKIHCPGKHCRNNLKKWDHTPMIVQFKSLAWGLPLQISLYFKEINELLLWSGSVWTSFTLKVFCGTVCNEVQWVFFSRLSSIAFLSLLIWLVFYYITEVHSWRRNYDQGQNPVWLCHASMRYTYYSFFRFRSLCCANCVGAKHSTKTHLVCTRCDLKLIYFVRPARKTRFSHVVLFMLSKKWVQRITHSPS